jgi:hypothetical protein
MAVRRPSWSDPVRWVADDGEDEGEVVDTCEVLLVERSLTVVDLPGYVSVSATKDLHTVSLHHVIVLI